MKKVFILLLSICITSSLLAQKKRISSPAVVYKTNLFAPVSLIGEVQFKNNFAFQLQFQYLYLYQPIGDQHHQFSRITGETRYFLTPRTDRINVPHYYIGLYTRSKHYSLRHLTSVGKGFLSTGVFSFSYAGQVFGFTAGFDLDSDQFIFKGYNLDIFFGGGYMPYMKEISDTDRRIDIEDPMAMKRFEFRLGFCIGMKEYIF